MGQKHLVKTTTLSWRVGVKIMKQSKLVLNKLPRARKGENVFGYNMQIDTGLAALVVALCPNRSKYSDTNRTCHVNGVESRSQL